MLCLFRTDVHKSASRGATSPTDDRIEFRINSNTIDMGTQAEGSRSDLGAPLPARNPNMEKNQAAPAQADPTGLKGNNQPPLPLLQNEKLLEGVGAAEQQTITQRDTEEAVRFLHEHKDGKFFLYLPHTAVHFPLYLGKEFHTKSNNGLIGDWIEEVDWSVGQVLDTLRELNLDEDVSESTDLVEKHPEIVAELMAFAQEMENDLGNEKIGPGCRALGRVENAAPIINADGTIRAEFR